MAPSTNFEKAKLVVEDGTTIECLFNPKDYSVSKSSAWQAQAAPGVSAGEPQYGGGNPYEMTLSLLFDASITGDGAPLKERVEALYSLMEPTMTGPPPGRTPARSGGSGGGGHGGARGGGGSQSAMRPPTVEFVWGSFISFRAFAKSLTVAFQLFAPDGQPLRADVKLALLQCDAGPVKGQNPTTRAEGGLGTHTVRDGDTLASVAYDVYGDPNRWRLLAEANGIDDPLALRRGQQLALPMGAPR
ncbi:MAG: LysM peptidoglycan-binding domain-containing protein [Solirubrobacteraceae bacterium]|nr:LysM peptidoglycan-binding domain-containing protein [Solirubrobacteraceae bacterium]